MEAMTPGMMMPAPMAVDISAPSAPAPAPPTAPAPLPPAPPPVSPANAVEKQPTTPANVNRAALVRNLFQQARSHKRTLIPRWRAGYQTLNFRPTGGQNGTPRIPKVWPVVASMVGWMTDQRPVIQVASIPDPFTPYGEHYTAIANDMNKVLASTYAEYKLDAEVEQSLWDMATYGIAWTKTTWEAHLADGLGDVAFRRIDPFTVYPDPFARSPRDMAYIIEARTMTLDDLDRAYPGARAALGLQYATEDVDEAPHQLDQTATPNAPRANLGALAPAISPRYASTGTPQSDRRMSDTPTVTVLEAWIRETETRDTDSPDTKQVIDNWRCVVACGNVVLFDHLATDCQAFNTHPYDRLVLFETGEMYGPALVEFMQSPQEAINRTLAAIESNVALMGNPMIVESTRAKSRQMTVTNRPGQRIPAEPGQFSWLNPPQLHPQMVTQLITYYESQIETISGMSAIVRGFSPSGRNSQGVLDSVQDAAFVRIRATLRCLERMLRGVAGKMAATVAEFYTEARYVAIIGDDGQSTYRPLRSRHFYTLPDADGDRTPLRFTLRADAGSTLPTSQQARAGDAMTLYGLGAIDQLELLKAMNWPNYSGVAKRVMEMQATGAQQPPGQRQASRA